MTALDTRARATASRLIAQYGKAVTYTRVVNGVYTDGVVASTTVVVPLKATLRGAAPRKEDDLYKPGDLLADIAGADIDFEPNIGDTVLVGSDTYKLMSPAKPTYSGELVALWTLWLRK